MGGGKDFIILIYDVADWDISILWELLGYDGNFAYVLIVAT